MKNIPAHPAVQPPHRNDDRTQWWNSWVKFVRDTPRQMDIVSGEKVYYGEHLFIGCETHNQLSRINRAIPRESQGFSDSVEYQDVATQRVWAKTEPRTLLLHEKILAEHCYITGPSGAGKSSLGIASLLIQLIRGAKTSNDQLPPPYPVVVIDMKGDQALFHTVRREAQNRGQQFQFCTTDRDAPTFRFNPFRGFDRSSRTITQLCQLILDALNLNHGKGYKRSYYTERSRSLLAQTLRNNRNVQSFADLHEELRGTLRKTDIRTRGDVFELLSVIEMLKDYPPLVTDPEETVESSEGVIFMPSVLKERHVAYFWLPAAMESIGASEIAKLVLFNLRVAAQDWKRSNPTEPRDVILVIDDFQRVAGENLQGILQDARAFGIHVILANQSLQDLRSPTGFDLAPAVMTNTRVKYFFTSPSERECYVYVERAKGFTDARQYPQRGNPFLRDLAPEEFAYHVQLGWPITYAEYKRREALPLPGWEDVPGGDFRRGDQGASGDVAEPAVQSDLLPRDFTIVCDVERARQVAAINALFALGHDQTSPFGKTEQ